jgi:hypothetical protein
MTKKSTLSLPSGPKIRFVAAECTPECSIPDCPYHHLDTWYVGRECFSSQAEAEKYVERLSGALATDTKSLSNAPVAPAKIPDAKKQSTKSKTGPKHREHTVNGARPLSFEEATKKYTERFTMDHVPVWANKSVARAGGKYPGPHYTTDLEWYKNTEFPSRDGRKLYCRSNKQSYPLGKWLDKPYSEITLGSEMKRVLSATEKKPDPRAIKRAENQRAKRLAGFQISTVNPVMEAIRNHQPEVKKPKKVPTVEQLLKKQPEPKPHHSARAKLQHRNKAAPKGKPKK